MFSHHCSERAHRVLPQIRQSLRQVGAEVPGNSCQGELCPSSLNEKRLLALKKQQTYRGVNTKCCQRGLKVEACCSVSLDLIIVTAEGAARRELCAGGLWGFRGRAPLAGDGKRCPLVTVQGDDPPGFVDDVMHAVFFQPTT